MINLLHWREDLRSRCKWRFLMVWLISIVLAIICLVIWRLYLVQQINRQQLANNLVKQQIVSLKPKYRQARQLQKQRVKLAQQIKDIHTLQKQDQQAVYLFKELVAIVPAGVHLTALTKQNNKIVITGVASLHTDVVEFVENIKQSTWFRKPVLQEVQSPTNSNNKFSLQCLLD